MKDLKIPLTLIIMSVIVAQSMSSARNKVTNLSQNAFLTTPTKQQAGQSTAGQTTNPKTTTAAGWSGDSDDPRDSGFLDNVAVQEHDSNPRPGNRNASAWGAYAVPIMTAAVAVFSILGTIGLCLWLHKNGCSRSGQRRPGGRDPRRTLLRDDYFGGESFEMQSEFR